MRRILLAIAISLSLFACSSSKKAAVPTGVNDGSSYATAVMINEKSEGKGIALEYAWLREHYPGHKVMSQSLTDNKGTPFDVITITKAGGGVEKVYFNISKFFGKF